MFELPLPAYIDKDAWNGFTEMRRSMPKTRPFTTRAAVLILKKLQQIKDAGHDPNEALDQSTLKGWSDVYVCQCQAIVQKPAVAVDETRKYLDSLRSVRADPGRVKAALDQCLRRVA